MIFPEYSEKSGEFDKNRETRRLYEFSGELECLRLYTADLPHRGLTHQKTCFHLPCKLHAAMFPPPRIPVETLSSTTATGTVTFNQSDAFILPD
jgi:hypothetical protein